MWLKIYNLLGHKEHGFITGRELYSMKTKNIKIAVSIFLTAFVCGMY